MVYPWAVMIGIGVGIAGLLFVLFQEERENRRRNTYGQRRIDSDGPSSWDFPDDEPQPATRNRRGSNRSVGLPGNCAICLESITSLDTTQELKCKHRFHAACIMKWFQEDRSCPNCRIRA